MIAPSVMAQEFKQREEETTLGNFIEIVVENPKVVPLSKV